MSVESQPIRAVAREVATSHTPESLAESLLVLPVLALLHSALPESPFARYSYVAAEPFLTLRAAGARCEVSSAAGVEVLFGNPWQVLERLLDFYELRDEADVPFPLGGCFGYWGYELKHFVEPKLPRRAADDLELPDCHCGFYDSLVVFDHRLNKSWIVSSGWLPDGRRSAALVQRQLDRWATRLASPPAAVAGATTPGRRSGAANRSPAVGFPLGTPRVTANLRREEFLRMVERAQRYIRAGDIYQVNLAQRLATPAVASSWGFYQQLTAVSPAPFAAYLDCGSFQLASSSPELFLRLSGAHVQTRPIKGTRPRASDSTRDAQLTYELQTSAKEMAELVMITDLLRNDLGRVCEYGSVQVPELVRLERYAQVQHLVSTVEGRLRPEVTHLRALRACFPGGSITGAPKIRAMEIIDELEPITRGPYTGCLGYIGFNRESQLSIIIRTALCLPDRTCFHVGAGIVADSVAEAEYAETLAKAGGFLAALERGSLRRQAIGTPERQP